MLAKEGLHDVGYAFDSLCADVRVFELCEVLDFVDEDVVEATWRRHFGG